MIRPKGLPKQQEQLHQLRRMFMVSLLEAVVVVAPLLLHLLLLLFLILREFLRILNLFLKETEDLKFLLAITHHLQQFLM